MKIPNSHKNVYSNIVNDQINAVILPKDIRLIAQITASYDIKNWYNISLACKWLYDDIVIKKIVFEVHGRITQRIMDSYDKHLRIVKSFLRYRFVSDIKGMISIETSYIKLNMKFFILYCTDSIGIHILEQSHVIICNGHFITIADEGGDKNNNDHTKHPVVYINDGVKSFLLCNLNLNVSKDKMIESKNLWARRSGKKELKARLYKGIAWPDYNRRSTFSKEKV